MTTPLLVEHLLDTPTHGVNHIEIYHSTAKAFVAEIALRSFGCQHILQCTRNETTTVGVIKIAGIFNKVDTLL